MYQSILVHIVTGINNTYALLLASICFLSAVLAAVTGTRVAVENVKCFESVTFYFNI